MVSFSLAGVLAAVLQSSSYARPVVTLTPLENVQQIVTENAPGTTFSFTPGVYRLVQVQPKDGDSFVGDAASVVLDGSVALTHFREDGGVYRAQYDPPKEQLAGKCAEAYPMCRYPEDCFLDSHPLRRAAALSEIREGMWFMDYPNHEVVIADNPKGHTIEVSRARSAFSGNAANVVISGLTVQKYATPAQMGAIGDQYPGSHWRISKCIVRWNHGTGIQVGDGAVVEHNTIVDNGQKGLGARGEDVLINDNDISGNNYAGFSAGWEAGGTKFARTMHLQVLRNHVHDNLGPGLWTDIDNTDTLYQENVVWNNSGEGIKHEISFHARIEKNAVWGNGYGLSAWLWGAQILLQNSSEVEVRNNTVVVPVRFGNGIGIIIQNRDVHVAKDNLIIDNDVTYLDAIHGVSGIACDYSPNAQYVSTNTFARNHYHVVQLGRHHWMMMTAADSWVNFQRAGQERNGTVDTTVKTPTAP